MGFKLIVPDPSSRIHLASIGRAGYCVGQSVNWILDIGYSGGEGGLFEIA